MLTLYLLQTFVPVFLIAWLAFFPPRSIIGFWIQAIALAIGLLAISLTGIWAFPPWWGPYGFATLLLGSIIFGSIRRRDLTLWPKHLLGWLAFAAFAALGVYSANEFRIAIAARAMPDGRSVDLASPLGPGTYLIVNGGSGVSINAHADALDQSVAAHRPYHGTGYGVDLVAIDRFGLRADAIMPAEPRRYRIFGLPVVAPCNGTVIAAVDGLPDMTVPKADEAHLAGNHVILRCKGLDILLGHFHKGSVRVIAGQRVKTGDAVAAVGNSGSSSEPHLHIHAQLPGTLIAPYSGAPIPIRIEGRYLVRNDRFVVRADRISQ
jgi:Peptidase family M23